MFNADRELKKWAPLLEHPDCEPIKDNYRRSVTAKLLEQQERAIKEERAQQQFMVEDPTYAGDVKNFDPVLIALVRRAMPNLIAYDVAGVQPMSGPTGLVFCMRSLYKNTKGNKTQDQEAWAGQFSESPAGTYDVSGDAPDTAFGGDDSPSASPFPQPGYTTAEGELLTDGTFGEMGFSIDKASVTARTRALKANYTMELAQDLKAIHGLDAEGELANILSTEILGEINREVIGNIYTQAKTYTGIPGSPAKSAVFDLSDSINTQGARWGAERFKALAFELDKVANLIAYDTRRGRGNFAITSANVASALAASGKLDYAPALTSTIEVDPTGNTFAGVLNGKMKIYIDPYANSDYVTVGYRGTNPYDAGLFYCPYVPLTMVRAVGQDDFQPRIAFKTRYGMISNPYVLDYTDQIATGELAASSTNMYFRRFSVINL